jgi:hypothetical protein
LVGTHLSLLEEVGKELHSIPPQNAHVVVRVARGRNERFEFLDGREVELDAFGTLAFVLPVGYFSLDRIHRVEVYVPRIDPQRCDLVTHVLGDLRSNLHAYPTSSVPLFASPRVLRTKHQSLGKLRCKRHDQPSEPTSYIRKLDSFPLASSTAFPFCRGGLEERRVMGRPVHRRRAGRSTRGQGEPWKEGWNKMLDVHVQVVDGQRVGVRALAVESLAGHPYGSGGGTCHEVGSCIWRSGVVGDARH